MTGASISVEDQAFTRTLGGERVVQDVRVQHRSSGAERIVRRAAAPALIDGQVIAAVAVNTDVTEARRGDGARLRAARNHGDDGRTARAPSARHPLRLRRRAGGQRPFHHP